MGLYVRYISTQPEIPSLQDLRTHLERMDPAASVAVEADSAVLSYGPESIAQIEVNSPADSLFNDERQELIAFVEDSTGPHKTLVLHTLQSCQSIVAVQVLMGAGMDVNANFARLHPLWRWLLDRHAGLLQVDGEGYHDKSRLILSIT